MFSFIYFISYNFDIIFFVQITIKHFISAIYGITECCSNISIA